MTKNLPIKIIVISCLLIGTILVGFEIYLRLKETYIIQRKSNAFTSFIVEQDPEYLIWYTSKGKRLLPKVKVIIKNHYLSKKDVLIETNSYGFRDKEIPQKKEKNEIRILALGDSITFGDYLNNEDVYVKRIEKYLQEIFPDKKIEVINTGVSDIGITEEIDILKENGLKTKPDLVLVGFYLNDTRPPWGFAQELGSRGWLRKHFLLAEYLYRQIKMRGWVKEKGVIRHVTLNQFEKQLKWKTDPKDFLKIISLTCFDWGAGWAADFRDILHCQLKELSRLSKQHHFKVMIVIFPVSYQIISDSTNDTPQKIVQEETRKFGFYCYDLLPLLRKQKPRQLYFDQCHPNKFANDLIGKAIAGELVEKIKKI